MAPEIADQTMDIDDLARPFPGLTTDGQEIEGLVVSGLYWKIFHVDWKKPLVPGDSPAHQDG